MKNRDGNVLRGVWRSGLSRFFSVFLLSLMVASFVPADALAKGKTKNKASPNAKYASIVMDADTGLILSQRNADKRLYPASLTKVMTLLMLFDAIEQGKVGLGDRITMSSRAAGMAPSKLGIPAGKTIKVEDAIYALVTKSANDIAVAVAEHVGGTESNFAQMMTRRAQLMGMDNTIFKNASGLHNPEQVSTARDMARLAQTVINRYPTYYRYFSTRNFHYNGHDYHNHNHLMKTYAGMDGMKTGYTVPAGFNLVASAVRNDRRLIGVVFGGRSASSRNEHMAEILDQGFDRLTDIRVADKGVLDREPPALAAAATSSSSAAIASYAASPESSGPVLKASPAPASSLTQLALKQTASAPGESDDSVYGEGDYDPEVSALPPVRAPGKPGKGGPILTSYVSPDEGREWSIQIGAFTSRAATDAAIAGAMRKLPAQYASASPVVAPLKSGDGWIFRARINGYSRDEALSACNYLQECMPVAP